MVVFYCGFSKYLPDNLNEVTYLSCFMFVGNLDAVFCEGPILNLLQVFLFICLNNA